MSVSCLLDVCECLRIELEKIFSKTAKRGKISIDDWIDGVSEVISSDLPWDMLYPYIVKVDEKYRVQVYDFFQSYHIQIETMIDQIIQDIARKLYCAQENIGDLFEKLDLNGDHKISLDEFINGLMELNLGLTREQIFDFALSFDTNKDGVIDYEEYDNRFDVECVYDFHNDEDDFTKAVVEQIGKNLMKEKSLDTAFKRFDINHDMKITFKEFVKMAEDLDSIDEDPAQLRLVFDYIDTSNNGTISLSEFKQGFKVEDSNSAWQSMAMQKISESFRKGKSHIKKAFITMDTDKSNSISLQEFKAGLSALDAVEQIGLTDDQMELLFSHIDRDNSSSIDYNEFLSAFKVKRESMFSFLKFKLSSKHQT